MGWIMKITLKNLGAIKQASFTLGDLTIICGKNNTGKTYVTYATYGFLDFWHSGLSIKIPAQIVNDVMEKGSISVPIEYFAKDSERLVSETCKAYSKTIESVFAGNERLFDDTEFTVEIDKDINYKANQLSFKAGSVNRGLLEVKKSEN